MPKRNLFVACTDIQMLNARNSGKFADHRAFVKWLFKKQHRVEVFQYELLKFEYLQKGRENFIKINGILGESLRPIT